MKNYYLLCICTILLCVMSGCQTGQNIDVKAQINNPATSESSGVGQKTAQTNSPENKDVLANPTPTVSDDGDTKSIYTDLASEKCKTIESNPDEGGSYRGECAGVGGYKLEVLEGDIRQSINVVFPDGKKSELEFWTIISGAFSYVGDKAEWRVVKEGKKLKPFALIVRFNASENPEKPEKPVSYLSVSKITGDSACVTDIVKPSKDQNITARKLADEAANKPCL